MRAIHPFSLAFLLAQREPIELVDVRPSVEFHRGHIRGARSIPLQGFLPAKVIQRRRLKKTDPLFLICGDHLKGSLAAGMLLAAGFEQAVIVEGGMDLWEKQGLPTVPGCSFRPMLRKKLDAIARCFLIPSSFWAETGHRVKRPFVRRVADNGWWCRDEFHPQELTENSRELRRYWGWRH
jgi:rhodanese-related sulfurtransferase